MNSQQREWLSTGGSGVQLGQQKIDCGLCRKVPSLARPQVGSSLALLSTQALLRLTSVGGGEFVPHLKAVS